MWQVLGWALLQELLRLMLRTPQSGYYLYRGGHAVLERESDPRSEYGSARPRTHASASRPQTPASGQLDRALLSWELFPLRSLLKSVFLSTRVEFRSISPFIFV